MAPPTKHSVKGALKAGFANNYIRNFPRVLVEALVERKGDSPVQRFIVNLQELLKNSQLVDKNFAFCPVKEDGRAKKIQDPSGIPTNKTLLSAHFKISCTRGRNPLEKQKVWKTNMEGKDEVLFFLCLCFGQRI